MPSYQVTSPEGKNYQITAPEGATQEQVLSYAKKQFAAVQEPQDQPQDKGFTERVKERLSDRQDQMRETKADYERGAIGPIQSAVQQLGKAGAGGVLDIIGEGLVSTGRGISEITPDSIEKPVVEAVGQAWNWLSETGAGELAAEALDGGVKKWAEFSNEHPQAAKTTEAVVNVGMLLAPAKVKANAKPSIIGKTAAGIEKKATAQTLKRRIDFASDLISPEKVKKVRIAETARTTEKGWGPSKRSVVELSPRELEIANEVSNIRSVTPKNSIQGNLNAISKANQKLAVQLDRDVGRRKVLGINASTSRSVDDAVALLVKENPVITGNAEAVANKIATKAKEIIASNPSTPKGMLDSRKQLDQWVKKQKGSKVFDPELESTISVSVRAVRNAINDSVEKSTGNVAVKKELKRQSLLYDALENIGPKAAAESNYAVGRLLQNVAKILPWRRSFQSDVGALLGLGIIGSSEVLAPVFAGGLAVSAVGYGGYRTIISPATKKALAKLVSGVDKALITSKNPSMIRQLRADRALVIELMKNSEIYEEEEN